MSLCCTLGGGMDLGHRVGHCNVFVNFNAMIGIIEYKKRFWTEMICQSRIYYYI